MFQSSFTRFVNQGIGLTGLLALALGTGLASADPDTEVVREEVITVSFDTDDGVNDTITVTNMAVGDSQVVTAESGREAYVTRHDGGLDIEIGGETVTLELLNLGDLDHGLHAGDVDVREWVDADGQKRIRILKDTDMNVTVDVDCDDMDDCEQVHKVIMIDKQGGAGDMHDMDGHEVIVTSGHHAISEEELKELLESMDVDLDDVDGEHQKVHVIRKEIHVTSDSDDGDQ